MRTLKSVLGIASVLGAIVVTSACNYVDPCTQIAPPNAQELAAARSGAGVERDTASGYECDLVIDSAGAGSWVRETE